MEEILCPEGVDSNFFTLLQKNIGNIESVFSLDIALRGNKIMAEGRAPHLRKFRKYVSQLFSVLAENGLLEDNDIKLSLDMVESGKMDIIRENIRKKFSFQINGKLVFPKTLNQRLYVSAVQKNDLIFSIGPAGTGKTFLAITMALHYLLNKRVERIVLTRPVVEAGEKLGFLPGDIQQKVNPYLRPLYDALYYLIGFERTAELIDKGIIEIAPLAYMRGRTIGNAFIILDEGQNTLNSQMKMFLTRFAENSKVIVTADITQIDLEQPKKSGIFKSIRILQHIHGIAIIYLTLKDIVRHPLVQKILAAYEKSRDES